MRKGKVVDALEGVKPGDELLLTGNDVGRKYLKQEPRRVTVHKVGRTLVHILRYDGKPDGPTDTYRFDSGVINDNYGHSRLWKPEDWELEKSRDELEAALKAHGVEVWRKRQPVPVLEKLLAVLEGEL